MSGSSAPIAGRYEVLEVLGQGSFAQTLLARDLRQSERLVAIKRLRPEKSVAWKSYEMFEREAAVLQSLRHHGIPAIHEHFHAEGEGDDAAYLVMEYVEGPSLARIIESRQHLDAAEVLQIALGLLDVLEYLHSRIPPVLHRDIKPANVLLRRDGSPVLVDFGAVRNVFLAPHESGSTVVGTYGYMPFEQYMGQASAASDLYALGATLLHVLSGRPPADFLGEAGHIEVPEHLPGGKTLGAALVRLLERSPRERFQSAREVRRALLEPVLAAPVQSAAASPDLPAVVDRAEPGELALQALEGTSAELYQALVPGPWRLLYPSLKRSEPMGGLRVAWAVLASAASLGILPLTLVLWHRYRQRRLKPFFERGVPAVARLLDRQKSDGEVWFRFAYEFEADGRRWRGLDAVAPGISRLWHVGDEVLVLYLPEQEHDSVIVGTR
jgi:hypothetical protein